MNKDFTIRLCGADVTVKYSDPTSWAGSGAMGRSNSKTGGISIAADLPDNMHDQTLLHEMVHMILDLHGLHRISEQESVVNILANSLLACMRDNPDLVARMSKGPVKPDKTD